MASSASYPRKYYFASNDEIVTPNTIPLRAGNVIAAYDTDAFYYDVPNGIGGEVIRRKANGIEFVGNMSDARQEPTTIFVVKTGTTTDENGNTINTYSGYRWNADLATPAFEEVFNNLRDFKVKSDVLSGAAQAYLVGSISASSDIGILFKSSAYITADGKLHGDLDGNAKTATNANKATSADSATNDTNGQPITSYVKDVTYSSSINSSILTVTSGSGNPETFNIKDTTYQVFTASTDGLVASPTDAHTQPSDNTNKILTGSGWVNKDNITIGTATKAVGDKNNKDITTYLAGATGSDNATGTLITFTNGAGIQSTVQTTNTKYSVFDTTNDGLVPKASGSGDTGKYLMGDHAWHALPVFDGTNAGIVPVIGINANGYLKGNGSWGGVFAGSGTPAGLVPAPASGDTNKFLKGDGTWSEGAQNTAGATQDNAQLYLVGAKVQTVGTGATVTYSNSLVYTQAGKLYQGGDTSADDIFTGDGTETTFELSVAGAISITAVAIDGTPVSSGYSLDTSTNSIVFTTAPGVDEEIAVTYSIPVTSNQVVDISSTQVISNKKVNIGGTQYAFGTACGSDATDTIAVDIQDNIVFSGDGTTTVFDFDSGITVDSIVSVTVAGTDLPSTAYTLDNTVDPNTITFSSAPTSGTDNIEVTYITDNPDYNPTALPTAAAVNGYVNDRVSSVADSVADKLDTRVIEEDYDTTRSYVIGDFCIFQDTNDAYAKLYRCINATSGTSANPEDFDSTKWTETNIIAAIKWIIANT